MTWDSTLKAHYQPSIAEVLNSCTLLSCDLQIEHGQPLLAVVCVLTSCEFKRTA